MGDESMALSTLQQWLLVAGTVATPIVVILMGYVFHRQNKTAEHRAAIEGRVHDDRLSVYQAVLKPFSLMFMSEDAWKRIAAENRAYKRKSRETVMAEMFVSEEWIAQTLRFSLIGSDEAVRAFGDLFQLARSRSEDLSANAAASYTAELMKCLFSLLLELRRSAGGPDTTIDGPGLLRWLITDIDSYFPPPQTRGK